MKTHIIQLESYDDIVSACDKMNWAKSGRVLLVWPEGRTTLNRRLDLILLKRRSAALGAQLALVTKDAEILYHAPRLGIPVFKNQRRAQDDNWRVPRRFRQPTPPPPHPVQTTVGAEATTSRPRPMRRQSLAPDLFARPLAPLARLGVFTAGVLALLAIAAILLPAATLEIAPQTQVQDVSIDVRTSTNAYRVELQGLTPSRWVSVTVEGRQAQPASGSMRIPERAASGEMRFTNLTDREVDIPVGTVVLPQDAPAPGQAPTRFAITQAGRLPAGPGQAITLPAQALTPGEEGNLPANRLTAIEGLIGAQASAVNPEPMRGGRSQSAPEPTTEDRRVLLERLTASLQDTALHEIQRLNPNDLVIASSLELTGEGDESFSPPEGLPGEQLTLSLRRDYRALVVSTTDLQRLAAAVFDANLPPGAVPVPDSLQTENVGEPLPAESEYHWQMHASRRMVIQPPPGVVVQSALGRAPAQALEQIAARVALDEPVRIRLAPSWWPRLPILPFRIRVIYAYSGG